jgi:uncharacterized MnhB-related membrane protein
VKLALYSALVSLLYALLAVANPALAETLVVAFVAALVVPACWRRARTSRRGRWRA